TIRCPNSHLVFVVVVVSGWRFSDSWRFSGSWRFRLFGVVRLFEIELWSQLGRESSLIQLHKALSPPFQCPALSLTSCPKALSLPLVLQKYFNYHLFQQHTAETKDNERAFLSKTSN